MMMPSTTILTILYLNGAEM